MKKLNFGCGPKILKDCINCDVRTLEGVDISFDFESFPYPISDNSFDYIMTEECLEHLPLHKINKILLELNRILIPGGQLNIQVPDIGKMCHYYVNKEICSCVPHKGDLNTFVAKPDCQKCLGKAKINDTRWLFAFTGAQKHPFDFHKMMFTKENLSEALNKAKFKNIKFEDHIYKLKASAIK